jgi:hypothetical protein
MEFINSVPEIVPMPSLGVTLCQECRLFLEATDIFRTVFELQELGSRETESFCIAMKLFQLDLICTD